MSCPEELELFLLREGSTRPKGDEDALTPERQREVAAHAATCAECQAKLAELDALGRAIAEPNPLPENRRAAFVADVIRQVESREPAETASGSSKFWTVGLPAVAAICCGLVALVVVPSFFVLSASRGAEEAAPVVAMERMPSEPAARDNTTFGEAQLAMEGEDDMDEASGSRGGPPGAAPTGGGYASPSPTIAMPPAPAQPSTQGIVRIEEAEAPEPERRIRGRGESKRRGRPAAVQPAEGRADDRLGGLDLQPSRPPRPQARPAPADYMAKVARSPAKSAPHGAGPGHARPSLAETPYAVTAPRPMAIDPNGRFATTYRPGRAHLARFETALFRGQVPEPALDLVGNAGGGSGPVIAAPQEQALALDVRTGMARLAPEGGPVHLALTVRSADRAPASRPEVAVHLVMDTSGSMAGQAIEHARQAARRLVELLEPGDRFSLVQYATDGSVVVPHGTVGRNRQNILRQIDGLIASGGTNLEAGLRLGYEQASLSRGREDAVQLVIVLSDGQPNQGVTDPWQLSEMAAGAFQGGTETTTIGVGNNYEPQVMSNLAEYGAGGYYYLPDASTIEGVLSTELDVRCQPVARGVELRIRLADGVELLEAYGSRRLNQMEAQRVRNAEIAVDHQEQHHSDIRRDREHDRDGGMRFFIPGFGRNDQHTILLRLRTPEGVSGAEVTLADVEMRYKDRILLSNQGDERTVNVTYAASRAEALSTLDNDVRRAVYTFRTGQVLSAVSGHLTRGDQNGAIALLYERSELLRRASVELEEPDLQALAGRLDAFRGSLGSHAMSNQLMMGALLQRAGSGMMR